MSPFFNSQTLSPSMRRTFQNQAGHRGDSYSKGGLEELKSNKTKRMPCLPPPTPLQEKPKFRLCCSCMREGHSTATGRRKQRYASLCLV